MVFSVEVSKVSLVLALLCNVAGVFASTGLFNTLNNYMVTVMYGYAVFTF